MNKVRFLKTLKKLVFPITLFSILSILSVVMLTEALYLNYTSPNLFSGFYISIVAPFAIGIWILYIFERILLRKIAYKIILLSEIGIAFLLFIIFSYQNSKTSFRIETNKPYILVLFDAPKSSSISFEKKGLFSKELVIKDTNIVHLNPFYEFKNDLKIETPEHWKQTTTDKSSTTIQGKKVGYLFLINSELPKSYIINNEKYIDSLLHINTIK